MDTLIDALSPLDGRYLNDVKELHGIFSEKALMQHRLLVECEYLIALSEHGIARGFSDEEKRCVRGTALLSANDFNEIKSLEATTKHDIKAVEYYMKKKLGNTSLQDSLEWIHFALTSEDVNNIAYALMLRDGLCNVIFPTLEQMYITLEKLADTYKDVPMLARTHGQPASPTTVGKEFKVFSSRVKHQKDCLGKLELMVKMNGATGNYNAHHAAYPSVDWILFSQQFIERFNNYQMIQFTPNTVTTQIEAHDSYAELFDAMRKINTIIIGLDQDMWRYISDEWFVQKPITGETGSSTMPHKVNPIDFENSEGNLGLANAMLTYFSTKLPISRLQRDLSDSTVKRNLGVAFGHCLLGYKSALRGLSKVVVDEKKVVAVLEEHPEAIAEAIQTILRREGMQMPYEKLKDFTRGRKVTLTELHHFIDTLQVSDAIKGELKQITPANYTGLAKVLASSAPSTKKKIYK